MSRGWRAGLVPAALLAAAAAVAGGASETGEEPPRMQAVYHRFSHRVGIRWEGDAVVLLLPAERAGRARELRLPGWPVPDTRTRPAPPGLVGVGFDGTPLINSAPHELPRPTTRVEGAFAPGPESPGRPGELLARPDLSALVGVLLDGFPLYGPVERDGGTPGDLDECGGHVGLTHDLERPIYHYHVTPASPQVCACLRGLPLRERPLAGSTRSR